jgi:hypothetical protein
MNRTALLTALQPVEELEEIIVPKQGGSSSFAIKDDGLYWRPAGVADEYKVGRESAQQALRHVPGLSAAAIKEWPTDLLLSPLNWWYTHGDGEVRALVSGQNVASFTKRADHGIHSPSRMLEAIEEALDEKGVPSNSFYYDKVRVGLDRVSFAVVTSDRADEVKVGDVMNSGIMAFGSPTGEAYIEVSPYLNRLICTNGMVSPVAMGRWSHRGGDGGSIFDWTKEMALQSWDAIDGELSALRGLTEIEVGGNVHNVLSDLFERHHVPAGQREAIVEAAVEEADGTMFGISQAFNRVANDIQDVAGMRHLLMVTGDVAHQTERCSACLRIVN